MGIIDLTKNKREALSVRRFLSLGETEKKQVKSVKIAPAILGSEGFGKVVVEYYTPRWSAASDLISGKRTRVVLANGKVMRDSE